jgi:hypothetical protein
MIDGIDRNDVIVLDCYGTNGGEYGIELKCKRRWAI